MALSDSDVHRLVHHYLLKEGFEKAADSFENECPHLGSRSGKQATGKKLTRFLGPSLLQLLDEYFQVKDYLIEELESLESTEFYSQDSLPTLSKTLVGEFKKRKEPPPPPPPVIAKPMCDASVNTDLPYEPSFERSSESSPTEADDFQGKEDEFGLGSLDLVSMCERLLEVPELHQKIADNINRKILNGSQPNGSVVSGSTDEGNQSRPLQDLVRLIAEETQSDPVFENVVDAFFGNIYCTTET